MLQLSDDTQTPAAVCRTAGLGISPLVSHCVRSWSKGKSTQWRHSRRDAVLQSRGWWLAQLLAAWWQVMEPRSGSIINCYDDTIIICSCVTAPSASPPEAPLYCTLLSSLCLPVVVWAQEMTDNNTAAWHPGEDGHSFVDCDAMLHSKRLRFKTRKN